MNAAANGATWMARETGLPVVVVDTEIYHRPPTMLIGTVDKFAMMAWRGETRTLFGLAQQEPQEQN